MIIHLTIRQMQTNFVRQYFLGHFSNIQKLYRLSGHEPDHVTGRLQDIPPIRQILQEIFKISLSQAEVKYLFVFLLKFIFCIIIKYIKYLIQLFYNCLVDFKCVEESMKYFIYFIIMHFTNSFLASATNLPGESIKTAGI